MIHTTWVRNRFIYESTTVISLLVTNIQRTMNLTTTKKKKHNNNHLVLFHKRYTDNSNLVSCSYVDGEVSSISWIGLQPWELRVEMDGKQDCEYKCKCKCKWCQNKQTKHIICKKRTKHPNSEKPKHPGRSPLFVAFWRPNLQIAMPPTQIRRNHPRFLRPNLCLCDPTYEIEPRWPTFEIEPRRPNPDLEHHYEPREWTFAVNFDWNPNPHTDRNPNPRADELSIS